MLFSLFPKTNPPPSSPINPLFLILPPPFSYLSSLTLISLLPPATPSLLTHPLLCLFICPLLYSLDPLSFSPSPPYPSSFSYPSPPPLHFVPYPPPLLFVPSPTPLLFVPSPPILLAVPPPPPVPACFLCEDPL